MRRKNTAELYYLRLMILCGACFAALSLLLAGIMLAAYKGRPEPWSLIFSFGLPLAACLPLFMISLVRYIRYRRAELTEIRWAQLETTAPERLYGFGWRGGGLSPRGFTAYFQLKGGMKAVKTKAVFFRDRSSLSLAAYSGKMVEIGFEPKRGEYIVLALS